MLISLNSKNKFSGVSRLCSRRLVFLWCFASIFAVLSVLPLWAKAANLYLDSSNKTVSLNDVFAVEARINLGQEPGINAVDTYLNYPADLLQVVDISYGNSILNIIAQPPVIDTQAGIIHFGGGITNGYTGKIPGDPGLSNLLVKIIFKVIKTPIAPEPIQITLDPKSMVFLNDGLGTPVQLTFNNLILTTVELSNNPNGNEWQLTLSQDKIPPETFSIGISRNPLIYDNKYFITFNTTDKQTGVDYYQVKEGDGDWIKTNSPYLLKNQNLRSTILVKAVDKAGNEKVVRYIPPKIKITSIALVIILMLVILSLIFIAVYFILKSFKTSKILK